MAANIIFAVSYAVYAVFFLKNSGSLSYPVYLAPFIIYLVIAAAAWGLNRINGEGMKKNLNVLFRSLYVFVILFAAVKISAVNFPDPHNFTLRKYELLLGCAYALFLICTAVMFAYLAFRKADIEITEAKDISKGVFIFFLVFYMALSLWFNYANQPTGDEPSYLIVTHSLIHDRDIDLANNYEKKDYFNFYKKELEPQGAYIRSGDKLFSNHPVLLSILILPFYLIGGRLGVTLPISCLSAFFISLIFVFTYGVIRDKKAAMFAALITGLTMPVIAFNNQISMEIINGVVILGAYMAIKSEKKNILLFSVLMAGMLWLHVRNIPIYGSLGLIFLYESRKEPLNFLKFAGIQAAVIALFFAYNFFAYGVIMPSYGENNASTLSYFTFNNLNASLAFLMDRQFGLVFYAPVFSLVFAGIIFFLRENKRMFVEMCILFLPYFALITSWFDWGGGSSAPRYLVQIMFIFTVLLAAVIKNIRGKKAEFVFFALSTASFGVSALVACVPWFRWDKSGGDNWIIAIASKILHFDLNIIFPSFRIPASNTLFLTFFWSAVIIAVNLYMFNKEKRKGGN